MATGHLTDSTLSDVPKAKAVNRLAHIGDSQSLGTYRTVKARFWPCLSGQSRLNLLSFSLFARERYPTRRVDGERQHDGQQENFPAPRRPVSDVRPLWIGSNMAHLR